MKNYVDKYFLKKLFECFNKKTTKVFIYGSFTLQNKGDYDVAVICDEYDENQKNQIEKILKELHRKFNLRVDEDVPYFNKTLFNYNEIKFVLENPPFKFSDGSVQIAPFFGNIDFFNSLDARYRLLINALTTKVKILNGNIKHERLKMFELLIGCIFSSNFNNLATIDKIIQNFCVDSKTYYSYKRFLGYNPIMDYKFLKKYIKKTLKKMLRQNKIVKAKKCYKLSFDFLNYINHLNFTGLY